MDSRKNQTINNVQCTEGAAHKFFAVLISIILVIGLMPGLNQQRAYAADADNDDSANNAADTPATIADGDTIVQIGSDDGGGDFYVPYYGWSADATVASLYTADEIKAANGGAGTIDSLAFCVENPVANSSYTADVDVYMCETDKTSLDTSLTFESNELTKVYSAEDAEVGHSSGWETWNLTDPFTYSGNKNLLVVVSHHSSSRDTRLQYYYSTTNEVCSVYSGTSANPYDSQSYITSNNRGSIQLGMTLGSSSEPDAGGTGDIVQIGTPDEDSTSNLIPAGSTLTNGTVASLYTADQINKSGTIDSIAFYQTTTGSGWTPDEFSVYMGTTTESTLTPGLTFKENDDYDLQLVYSKEKETIGSDDTGWDTWKLDTPFEYDGTKNLVVVVSHTVNDYSSLEYSYQEMSDSSAYYHLNTPDSSDSWNDTSYGNPFGGHELGNGTEDESVVGKQAIVQLGFSDSSGSTPDPDTGSGTTITIGEGDTANSVPLGDGYPYGSTAILYEASELENTSGEISSIAFDVSEAGSYTTDVCIYMGESDSTQLTGMTSFTESNFTKVYESENATVGESTGWETWTLDTPFNYSGEKNLIVIVTHNGSANYSDLKYNCTSSDNHTVHKSSGWDTTAANPFSGSFSAVQVRPNAQITFGASGGTSESTHKIDVPSDIAHGSISVDPTSAAAGDTVTVTATSEDGYQCDGVTVTGKTFGDPVSVTKTMAVETSTWTFTMPNEDVTISATFSEISDTPEPWDGTTSTTPPQDDDGTYLISSPDELAGFRDLVNDNTSNRSANAKLTADINMGEHEWTPIATYGSSASSTNYSGTFDGAGYTVTINDERSGTVSNALYWGFFRNLGGTVKDLTLDGSFKVDTTSSSGIYGAGFAAYGYGGATVTGCTNNITIDLSSSGQLYAAGFIAYDYGSTFVNCANVADMTVNTTGTSQYARAGGIVGYESNSSSYASGHVYVENCYNWGNISATNRATSSSNAADAGGMIANLNYPASGNNYIYNCYTSGDVSATASSTSAARAGAMVGYIYLTSSARYTYLNLLLLAFYFRP